MKFHHRQVVRNIGRAEDWPEFLDDFHHHWPTDGDNTRVDFIRHGDVGRGALRCGDPQWLRLTEQRCKAKSVFRFGVNGEVAKSTHSGLPWLRYLRNKIGGRIHFWPFDGWLPKPGLSVIVEVYPSLWNRTFPSDDRDSHQQDAYSIARWMRENDANGSLEDCFRPRLQPAEQSLAQLEGWILGVD